jgi:hypothetical protein
VVAGKSHFSTIARSFGTTIVIITIITPAKTNKIKRGYIIADFIFHDKDSTFSI